MTTEEFANAKALWKFFYAQECFRRVGSTCVFILKSGIKEGHPAYYPLVVGIYVLYGKPFKDTKVVGVLSKKIVPAQFRPLHDIMMKHRDEVYAHTQPGANSERLLVRVSRVEGKRKAELVGRELYARLPTLSKIIELCRALFTTMEQRRVAIQNRYFPEHVPQEEGEYPLNIFDPAGPFFLAKQPPSEF